MAKSIHFSMDSMTSVKQFLDSIKPGFAVRFLAIFEEIGFEDVSDLRGGLLLLCFLLLL